MNLQADAMTRAAQIAAGALKTNWWNDGRKLRDFPTTELRNRIAEYLAQHPEVIERAAIEVASWRANFTTGAQKRSR